MGRINGASERDRTSDLLITNQLAKRFILLITKAIRWGAKSIVLTCGADTPFLSNKFEGAVHCAFSPASRFRASSTSGWPRSESFIRVRNN